MTFNLYALIGYDLLGSDVTLVGLRFEPADLLFEALPHAALVAASVEAPTRAEGLKGLRKAWSTDPRILAGAPEWFRRRVVAYLTYLEPDSETTP